jgi:hypothetical protein
LLLLCARFVAAQQQSVFAFYPDEQVAEMMVVEVEVARYQYSPDKTGPTVDALHGDTKVACKHAYRHQGGLVEPHHGPFEQFRILSIHDDEGDFEIERRKKIRQGK